MQAITTKYLPATNTKPSRVKATAQAGSVIVSYDSALRDDDAHKEAALALCRKFGWEGYLAMGTTHQGDNVWVFVPHIGSDIRWDDMAKAGNPIVESIAR